MAIDQGQSGWGTTTGGSPFRSGGLSLRARAWFVVLCGLAVAGCASPERLPPVPAADTARALPLGLANARFFPLGTRTRSSRNGSRPSSARGRRWDWRRTRSCPPRAFPRHFRRRRRRRVRFRPAGRLDRSRRSPRVSDRDGRQHRCPDRPVRVPRAGLRQAAPRRLHDDLGRRRLQRAGSHRRHLQ